VAPRFGAVVSVGILPLRDYQRECVDAIRSALAGGMRRPATVLPTGAGKTVVFAHLIVEWMRENPGRRVLVLAHRTELIEQAAGKVRAVAPGLKVGIVKAERNETLAPVIVASVQTLASENRRLMLRDVGLIVVDECHHATANTYLSILTHYGALGDQRPAASGHAVAVGFTATMVRGDGSALGDVWQDVVYSRSIGEMIGAGYLERPRGLRVQVDDLDLTKVRKSGGDYRDGDLDDAITDSLAPEAIAKAIGEHAPDAPGFVFAPGVESARIIGEAVNDAGFPTALVHGGTSKDERKATIERFTAGEIQFLSNCGIFTEGTDLPRAETCVIARPTLNAGLYQQMVGRVLRPYPGKSGALVLDVVGASARHDLLTRVELFGESVEIKGEKLEGDDLDDLNDEIDEWASVGDMFGGRDVDPGANGPLVAHEVDLFHGSTSLWLRTYGGVWFLPAGDRYIAIVRGVDGYDVTSMHRYQAGTGRWVEGATGVADLSYAMAWAEREVTPTERTTALKDRSWRAKRPSDTQRDLAARYAVIVTDDMRSGEVSNAITVAMASQRIDPRTPEWRKP